MVAPLPGLGVERADARGLVRGEDGELDAGLGQHLEAFAVDRCFRQPHALGVPSEAMPKIHDGPVDLGDLVAPGRERHDHVVVDLGDRVAVTAPGRPAPPVGLENLRVDVRAMALEPGGERRTDVEGDLLVVVDDVEDAIIGPDAPRGGVRRVALGGHALVPVVPRVGRGLGLDRLEPGVLAGRLVEVAVDGDELRLDLAQKSSRPERNSRRPPRGITTSPEGSTW